jgi:hypothetical protein
LLSPRYCTVNLFLSHFQPPSSCSRLHANTSFGPFFSCRPRQGQPAETRVRRCQDESMIHRVMKSPPWPWVRNAGHSCTVRLPPMTTRSLDSFSLSADRPTSPPQCFPIQARLASRSRLIGRFSSHHCPDPAFVATLAISGDESFFFSYVLLLRCSCMYRSLNRLYAQCGASLVRSFVLWPALIYVLRQCCYTYIAAMPWTIVFFIQC